MDEFMFLALGISALLLAAGATLAMLSQIKINLDQAERNAHLDASDNSEIKARVKLLHLQEAGEIRRQRAEAAGENFIKAVHEAVTKGR